MKLIIGLGNPGEKYERTRHNAGFWLIERFAAQNGIAMRKDAKFQALVGRHAESGVWLLLPQTFMNASGRPVQMMASFFKIAPADILVVHDELDFAPGVAKVKQGGGIAGHNGLRDISARLGSHDYWRLRIGIGHPGDRQGVSDYVLNKPSADDRAAIDETIGRALDVMPLVLAGDMPGVMLKLHTVEKMPVKVPEKAAPEKAPAKAKEKTKEKTPENASAAESDAKPAAATKRPKADKPAVAESSAQQQKAMPAPEPQQAPAEEEKGGLKSLFKKLLPDGKK
ncbi:MAG: aminoacyl-tRNA hydrolase [Proteobacteria bacterium]|nr:aminoacyl-tRNA hydrolase [Pseudomonadota bacterium]